MIRWQFHSSIFQEKYFLIFDNTDEYQNQNIQAVNIFENLINKPQWIWFLYRNYLSICFLQTVRLY